MRSTRSVLDAPVPLWVQSAVTVTRKGDDVELSVRLAAFATDTIDDIWELAHTFLVVRQDSYEVPTALSLDWNSTDAALACRSPTPAVCADVFCCLLPEVAVDLFQDLSPE